MQRRQDRISQASSGAPPLENPNPLATLAKAHPSIVPEVPEAMENDEHLLLPQGDRDAFNSMQSARIQGMDSKLEQAVTGEQRRQYTMGQKASVSSGFDSQVSLTDSK